MLSSLILTQIKIVYVSDVEILPASCHCRLSIDNYPGFTLSFCNTFLRFTDEKCTLIQEDAKCHKLTHYHWVKDSN